MKLAKSILLGSAIGLIGVAGAQAADLPSRKSAPIQYVRICDAYGAGFFYIPGTDTCLKIGGLVVAEARTFDARFGAANPSANGTSKGTNFYSTLNGYTSSRQRDTYGYGALGRVELDARTGSAWGTVRTFIRLDGYYGGGTTASTGSDTYPGSTILASNLQPAASRYTVLLNKAFIQFGGLTAGYAQSMFDFYADAYNYESLRGSNSTSALFAYTATFGNGFTGTISAEDQYSRRGVIGTDFVGTTATASGGRLPDFVANIRYDSAWGAVQLSGASHYVNSTLYNGAITAAASPAPFQTSNQFGFAGQLGIQYNLNQLAPGDKLWFQATYQKGASSYTEGGNLSFINGAPGAQRTPGQNPSFFNVGYAHSNSDDCVFTMSGSCDRQEGYVFLLALKHYWMPTLSSGVYGSYYKINNSEAALNAGPFGAYGATNFQEVRAGTNLVWTPIKGLDIGAEFFYFHLVESGPSTNAYGAANQAAAAAAGGLGAAQLPKFTATQNVYEGRLRVQRAF